MLGPLLFAAGTVILGGMPLLRAQDQPAAAAPGSDDPVVMTVGDQKITKTQFEEIAADLPPQFQDSFAEMGKKGFAQQLANLMSLTMEAEKRKIDQTGDFQRMLAFERKVLLAQLMMNQIAAELGPVGKEEIEYYYQTHKDDYEQVKVTGIYIPFVPPGGAISIDTPSPSKKRQYTEQQAEQEALELRAEINSGSNMGLLAKAYSVHPTAAKSGDFGYIGHTGSGLDPKVVTAIFALQLHVLSAPIKDKNGYYLFVVDSKRSQPLDEVQKDLEQSLSMEKLNRRMEAIKDAYPETFDPAYFAEPATPGKPAATASAPASSAK